MTLKNQAVLVIGGGIAGIQASIDLCCCLILSLKQATKFAHKRLLEDVGIEPERFQLRWISASEGAKFAQTITEITEEIKALDGRRQPPPEG